MDICKLSFARLAPALCFAQGLFQSLKNGTCRSRELNATHSFGDNGTVSFVGPQLLGIDDMRVLQGVVAMAGAYGKNLTPEPSSELGQRLRAALALDGSFEEEPSLAVRCSYRGLAREIGYGSVDDSNARRKSLDRLEQVFVVYREGMHGSRGRLLTHCTSGGRGGVHIALNPLLVPSITGVKQYVRIDMNEVRALSGKAVRVIHQRLCAMINAGSNRRLELDTLCGYAWPEEAKTDEALRKRRERVKRALDNLGKAGWTVEFYAPDKVRVHRPSYK